MALTTLPPVWIMSLNRLFFFWRLPLSIINFNIFFRLVNMLDMAQVDQKNVWKIVKQIRKSFLSQNTEPECIYAQIWLQSLQVISLKSALCIGGFVPQSKQNHLSSIINTKYLMTYNHGVKIRQFFMRIYRYQQ